MILSAAAAAAAAAPTDPITAPAISFSQTAPVLIVLGGAVLAILFEAFLPQGAALPGPGRAGHPGVGCLPGLDRGRRDE